MVVLDAPRVERPERALRDDRTSTNFLTLTVSSFTCQGAKTRLEYTGIGNSGPWGMTSSHNSHLGVLKRTLDVEFGVFQLMLSLGSLFSYPRASGMSIFAVLDHSSSKDETVAKDRPLNGVLKKLGRIDALVEQYIHEQGCVNVLEVGCGRGLAMHELKMRYGGRLSIVGVNIRRSDGCHELALSAALEQGVVSPEQHAKLGTADRPKYVIADAGICLPFSGRSFDVIYSRATAAFIVDKIHFLEEVNRVLKDQGIARIEMMTTRLNFAPPFDVLCEIKAPSGQLVAFEEFITAFKSITVVARDNPVLQLSRIPCLDFGLQLSDSVNLQRIDENWWGIKSCYEYR